jgi:hypothetical protein
LGREHFVQTNFAVKFSLNIRSQDIQAQQLASVIVLEYAGALHRLPLARHVLKKFF